MARVPLLVATIAAPVVFRAWERALFINMTRTTRQKIKELDTQRNDIIACKTPLKADVPSGGQQNKDEHIVQLVTRMNELKENDVEDAVKWLAVTMREPR